jgi:hypothetical protein
MGCARGVGKLTYLVNWVEHGVMASEQAVGGEPIDRLHARRFEQGFVRVVSGPLGTEIKWMIGSPCTASVLRAVLQIAKSPPPYVLRFHLIGWFEEVYALASDAVHRMEDILARGDRYFPTRAFLREGNPLDADVPPVIRESIASLAPPEDFIVECTVDGVSSSFVVDKVGPKSAIGRVWGTLTSSYPCQPTSRYGDTVSEAYAEVLRTGVPRYHQVLAALRMPDNQIHWVPYHRVIFPKHRSGGPAVAVLSQIAKVDIKVI